MLNITMSELLIVKILPNRKLFSSGTYPGVINTNITPIAMPIAHITAIAESSLTLHRLDIASTSSDELTANTADISIGLTPR